MTSIRAIPTLPRDARPAHRRRARGLLVAGTVAALGALSVLSAGPAMADPSAESTITFTVTGAGLDVTAPATANLGSGVPNTAITGALGAVTVTDSRASADATWGATLTSSDFTTGAGTSTETVLATEVGYWSGAATATTGTGTFTPGQATVGAAALLNNATPLTAFSHTGGTGNNTAAWNPTIVVHVPLSSESGTYTGTVTHSVA